MSYLLDFSDQALDDITSHKKSGNKPLLKKLNILLEEISSTPFKGKGKPEALKHDLSGYWSRRLSQEHRIIYREVDDTKVLITSAKGHYR